MSISITGINGFVGGNLTKYFQLNQLIFEPINLRSALDYTINDGVDTIIHLAGKAHDLKNTSAVNDYYTVNYELTKQLYDKFLTSNAKKFIFISSIKAAADQAPVILTENIIADPQTHYGKSKLLAEQYIQSQQLPAGKLYYILRPCMIHGPDNKGNLNLLFNFLKKGIPYPLAGFNNKRSFLSVGNLCFVIKELATRQDIPSGVYHVADDEPLSTNELIRIISAGLNLKPNLWHIWSGIIKIIARTCDVLHLPLTTERLGKLTDDYVVSNAKIKKALNKPFPLTAVQGLEITIKSFKN